MLVFILDLDGTVVGNIANQAMLYEICKITHKKFNLIDFRQKLLKTLLRPYVIDFLRKPNSEFFVYSAGSKVWVEFIVKQIEIIAKMKFNRPLFTRQDCQDSSKKCYDSIKPKINKILKKKYNRTFTPLIIDNNNVYINDSNLIVCPTYDEYVVENIPTIIDSNTYKKYYKDINKLLKIYFDINLDTNSYKYFQYVFYSKYITLLKNKRKPDNFIYKLDKLITDISEFNMDNINYIKKRIT